MAQDVFQTTAKLNLQQWLFLAQLDRFGFQQLQQLISALKGKLSDLFSHSYAELKKLGFTASQCQQVLDYQQNNRVDTGLTWLQQDKQHQILTLSDSQYPYLLRHIDRPPFVLFCKGETGSLHKEQIAIVGSRAPSATGKHIARQLAEQLSEYGWVITSGLALGIDGLAHRGALNAQGQTNAVLGCGLQQMYPKRHKQLAEDIVAQGGCLTTEFFPDEKPLAQNFPRRNRIVSGLSLGCVVVEAAIKSGSLISARYALEQGREVFAVPGNINNPLAKGGHYLIKQGAKLVEDIHDINEEFQNLSFWQGSARQKNTEKSQLNSLATDKLLDSVGFEVTSADVISERSGQPLTAVLAQLLEYELRGLVTTAPGGYIKLGGKSHV